MLEEDKSNTESGTAGEGAAAPRWVAIGFALLVVGLAASLYVGHAAKQELLGEVAKSNQRADMLEKQIGKAGERIADLQGEIKVTSEKLGLTQEELNRARSLAQSIRKEQQASGEILLKEIDKAKAETTAQIGKVAGDVTGAKSDIEATRKDLEATKGRLERTTGDLGVQSGLIARNKEELEELKRRGERNVFDFDIKKTKDMQRVGPVQVRLQKTDPKKFKYTLTVFADDKSIEKKDKNVNEPVQFYVRGSRTPYEIVVFELGKDRAVGYLTTPKDIATRQ
jgi:predicted  nucleic acid-binding Zn-ribbon protein